MSEAGEEACFRAGRGLLLFGKQIREGDLSRKAFLTEIRVTDSKLRKAGGQLGTQQSKPGIRFFDSARETISFGPGAGLVLGVSLGTQSLRAALVDANGDLHCKSNAPAMPEQLLVEPSKLLDRIADITREVIEQALDPEEGLLAEGSLRLLGVSVAWPAPVKRDKSTVGEALRHDGWRLGEPLDKRVAARLDIDRSRSHAINDAAAAAVGVCYLQTSDAAHLGQTHPELAMVLRLAGGVGASTIVVEKPEGEGELGKTSGFPKSILTGGIDHLAGEIGHVPVDPRLVDHLNEAVELPDGVQPLEPLHCSCAPGSANAREHLEAYVGAAAVARRLDPDGNPNEVVARIVDTDKRKDHKRVLDDAGTLIAASLVGSVAMLNPGKIFLSGALASTALAKSIEVGLRKVHSFGSAPQVRPLPDEENDFIRVKGAGMVVLRNRVFRRMPKLLHGPASSLHGRVAKLTEPVTRAPW